MRVQQTDTPKMQKHAVRYVYLITVFFLILTGFGQMPIFKRYYIADIPGLGWLAQFYVTHYIHYLGAILLLVLVAYMIIDYLLLQRKSIRLTTSGYIRGAILTGILLSGLFLVLRNLEGSRFAPGFIIFLDLTHLGLVMMFLIAAGYCLARKKRWIAYRHSGAGR
jgi:putative Mn2+ efflux pump MntP